MDNKANATLNANTRAARFAALLEEDSPTTRYIKDMDVDMVDMKRGDVMGLGLRSKEDSSVAPPSPFHASQNNVHPFHIQNQFQNQNLNYFKSPHHKINMKANTNTSDLNLNLNANVKLNDQEYQHNQDQRTNLIFQENVDLVEEHTAEVIVELEGGDEDGEEVALNEERGWRRRARKILDTEIIEEAWCRGRWLLALMVLQSSSSFLLEQFSVLLREHLVVTLFLTMLVGAGGNAGNQSAIKVIEGMATKKIKNDWHAISHLLTRQVFVGLLLGVGLAGCSFLRVLITDGDILNSIAISVSILSIVFFSVVLGSSLPFFIGKLGFDPGNAATCIQVLMDIIGVAITCVICKLILG